MRILAINQFYAPDHSATSQLLTDLCEDLAARGEHVSVIASPGGYQGGAEWPSREVIHGVHVSRPWATALGKSTLSRRMVDYGSFWASAVGAALKASQPDVVLSLTTPPLIAAGAALASALRNVPLVSWVQDIYPDVAVEFGVLRREGLPARALESLMRTTYARSARIVALADVMRDRLVAKGAAPHRISVIPNWSDGTQITPVPRSANAFRKAQGWENAFVVMYSGNLGVGHDMETLLQAAHLLRDDSGMRFVFVGGGAREAEARALAKGLPNVTFLPYQPREKLGESLSAADVHWMSLREGLQGLLVPSKIYGILAAGRPVIYVGPEACEGARIVAAHDVGFSVRNGDGAGVSEALRTLSKDESLRMEMGNRARTLFESRFDRSIAVTQWHTLLKEVCAEAHR